jgi:hypothetical protein
MTAEQRHFTRIPFNASATIINSRSGQKISAELIDISFKGVLIKVLDDWQGNNGEHYTLHLSLAENEVEINMAIIEVHKDNNLIGFKTEHMDLDTATHLRRLVELNLGNENLLEREFSELIQSK